MTKPKPQPQLTAEQRLTIAYDDRRDLDIAREYGITPAMVVNCRRMHGIFKKPARVGSQPANPDGIRTLRVEEWIAELRAKGRT